MWHGWLDDRVVCAFKGLSDGRQSSQDIGHRVLRTIDDHITQQ
jgi:hypothetical protein